MRTQDEIVAHYEQIKDEDMFGWRANILFNYLDFSHARPFLKPEVTAEEWNLTFKKLNDGAALGEMQAYMEIAWEKSIGHRGLSAGRSIEKIGEYLWLLGDDEMYATIHLNELYRPYGAPALAKVCEKYGLPIPSEPEAKRMISGESCSDSCHEC